MEVWSLGRLVEWRLGSLIAALIVVAGLTSIGTSLHILLHKRASSSAVAWVGLVWLSPLIGAGAYLILGINRVQRKAARLLGQGPVPPPVDPPEGCELPEVFAPYAPLAHAVARITGSPLIAGNRIDVLRDGDQAYPAMLEAIRGARRSVSLQTYILDHDRWGLQFVAALIEAHRRGVAVRVLVDGIGARRSWRTILALRRAGVPTEIFLWSWAPWKMALVNLRNHRKLAIVDGRVSFTGGLNIREAAVHHGGSGTVHDLHFRVGGWVVRRLQEQFALDWAFSSGERLSGPDWFPELTPVGSCVARVIPDGPDEDLLKLSEVLFQAISAARNHILVVTPYFVPPEPISVALGAAAQRGVVVEVVSPEHNQPRFMTRVALHGAEVLLERGVRLGLRPGVFEHTKLFVVDCTWILFGSANWDQRSLRLNFELNVEAYDPVMAAAAIEAVGIDPAAVQWITVGDLRERSLGRRLGDAGLSLFQAYL